MKKFNWILLVIFVSSFNARAEICSRSKEVQEAILSELENMNPPIAVPHCKAVTDADLARVKSLFFYTHWSQPNRYVHIYEHDLDSLSSLESLSFSHAYLTGIDSKALRNLQTLRNFSIEDQNAVPLNLPDDVFEGLRLRQVTFEKFKLLNIPKSLLSAGMPDVYFRVETGRDIDICDFCHQLEANGGDCTIIYPPPYNGLMKCY